MRITRPAAALAALALLAAAPGRASAQPIGAFRWQLQPYCNVVAVTVTQVGNVYRLEGIDDQCGAGRDQAAVQGLAFPNPDGTIGFGLTIVTAPGGVPVHVDAEISLASLSGTWRDSATASGTFAFTPGAGSGGSARPQPSAIVPSTIRLLTSGSLLATAAPGGHAIPAEGPGARLMWHAGKAAFRAGTVNGSEWDDVNVGQFSTAFGHTTRAGGPYSTALGVQTYALGLGSTAIGHSTGALGDSSTSMGSGTVADGASATATGHQTRAGGVAAFSAGRNTKALGDYSVAMGFGSETGGKAAVALGELSSANGAWSVALGLRARTLSAAAGSFVFADASSSTTFTSFGPNEFVVRAAGGVGFYTNAAATTGAEMAPGGGSWAALSDVNLKENFRDVSGEAILAKLAAMPIREWNYTSQDPGIRHLGPTAQDFRAAFGLGEYERRITATDADGIALAGVQALYARTRALEAELERLRQQLDALTSGPK